ncbi:MAG: hypothetical protein ABIH72_04745 [archaeon]
MYSRKRGTRALSCDYNKNILNSKRSQITVFVIIAIVIVCVIGAYFVLKDRLFINEIPVVFQPVEEYYLSCIDDLGRTGAEILGEQGGYIYLPEFEAGSEYRPFSSQLNFYGTGVPYWYYVSGNNIIKEQKPTKSSMESDLEKYIEENIGECDFREFTARGFDIEVGDSVNTDVSISNNKISVNLARTISMSYGEESAVIKEHKKDISSSLGRFYSLATKIYDSEKQEAFLENYAVDVLRLYAPVDGVELSCSPKVWLYTEIEEDLKAALESNIMAIKLEGDYYSLSKKQHDYFVHDIGVNVDSNINFLYSKDWPFRFEVWESNNGVLIGKPVGMQEGLGILGFCYVPYHFVYDLNFPVMIQIYNGEELFQFPVAVIIDKNKQREALPVESTLGEAEPEMCKYKTQEITVYTYDVNLEPVEAEVIYNCLGASCDIGSTRIEGSDAILVGSFPQCINGFVYANAEGYASNREIFSTNKDGVVNIVLDKLYNLEIEFTIDEKISEDRAIISFVSEDNTQTVSYPDQDSVKLSEGMYNISVYAYSDSKVTIPGLDEEICTEVPKEGLLGVFGVSEEKCFDVNTESQEISNSISGGGNQEEYLIESQLQTGKIKINVDSIPVPDSIDDLQDAYNLVEVLGVDIGFG